jgi:hypothetical protein
MCGRHPEASDTIVAEGEPSAGPRGPSGVKRKNTRTWACRLCTFAENDPAWLRCQICDTVKGSTVASLPALAADAGAAFAAEPRAGVRPRAARGGAPLGALPTLSRLRQASCDPATPGVARSPPDSSGPLPHLPQDFAGIPAWARIQGRAEGEDAWRCGRCGHVALGAE